MAAPEELPSSSESLPRVHANAMAAWGGPFDLTLEFGYRPDPTGEPEPQVRVTMSYEHALAMIRALRPLVDSYEEQAGPLPDLEKLREAQ